MTSLQMSQAERAPATPPPPKRAAKSEGPTACALYLPKKSRYCHFAPVPGYAYCTHHLAARNDDNGKGDRIPCPLDGSHSIFRKDLTKHLKVCPRAKEAAREAALPCFKRNINYCGEEENTDDAVAAATVPTALGAGQSVYGSQAPRTEQQLSATPVARVLELIGRVREAHRLHAAIVASPPPPDEPSTLVESRGKRAEKHHQQHEAMVRALRVLRQGNGADGGSTGGTPEVIVELGAGKGGLSAALSEHSPSSSFVLIDWSKPHAAVDPGLRDRGVGCVRYKIDLRHVWLRGVPELQWDADAGEPACIPCDDANRKPVRRVAVAKHLCGGATDFALQSIVSAGGATGAAMEAIMIATCCHHKCTWGAYVNRPFLQGLGFNEEDFALLTMLSSWATTCKGGGEPSAASSASTSTTASACGDDDEHAADNPEAARLSQCLGEQMDGAARRELGRMCKRLLDTGRLKFLEEAGNYGGGRLERYVSEEVSPENVLLMALGGREDRT